MSDYLLQWLSTYGLAAYFIILVISSAGIPFPITLMLIVAGSFVEQGEMQLWQALILGVAGAVIGDQIGYCSGRFGGRRLLNKIVKRFGGEEKIERAKTFTKRWGGAEIFFSRWLVTLFGPWINLTSGAINYPWTRFVFWDIAGEICWVVLYVLLGRFFSDRVQAISDLSGSLAWTIIGIIAAAILGWKLLQIFRVPAEETS
ncbi:MAG: DedA family protein [Pyrinomonadaceae bacterium]